MVETFVDEHLMGLAPSSTLSVKGVWMGIRSGTDHIWAGILGVRIYSMVCSRLTPSGVWFGTGLAVEYCCGQIEKKGEKKWKET